MHFTGVKQTLRILYHAALYFKENVRGDKYLYKKIPGNPSNSLSGEQTEGNMDRASETGREGSTEVPSTCTLYNGQQDYYTGWERGLIVYKLMWQWP